ncbi:MAG TPA: hypothetical protein VNN15_01415 [Solirubrobacterales bacterium]|nr:hypothetical protein [Solirubrobacterales bacterium]
MLTRGSAASDRALDYLRNSKRSNGGFASRNNLAADSQATAWAVQGLLSAGKDPGAFGAGKSSLTYLVDLQAPDGHFLKAPGQDASPVWVTSDVLVPLAGRSLPVSAPPRETTEKAPKSPKSATPDSKTAQPSGGAAPAETAPSAPPPSSKSAIELLEKFDKGSGSAPAAPSTGGAPPSGGGKTSEPPGVKPGTGGVLPEDLGSIPSEAVPDTSELAPGASEASDASGEPAAETTSDSSSSTAGAILLGLLAGCVLFALALAARRGWMRWRYGL